MQDWQSVQFVKKLKKFQCPIYLHKTHTKNKMFIYLFRNWRGKIADTSTTGSIKWSHTKAKAEEKLSSFMHFVIVQFHPLQLQYARGQPWMCTEATKFILWGCKSKRFLWIKWATSDVTKVLVFQHFWGNFFACKNFCSYGTRCRMSMWQIGPGNLIAVSTLIWYAKLGSG